MSNTRELSEKQITSSEGATLDAINTGSLQRIADATEKMALKYTELLEEVERYRQSSKNLWDIIDRKNKTIASLKGQITKLKKKTHKS